MTKTLKDHTLPDIKTLSRTFFYSCKVLGMKDYDLERHFPDQNSRILGVPMF